MYQWLITLWKAWLFDKFFLRYKIIQVIWFIHVFFKNKNPNRFNLNFLTRMSRIIMFYKINAASWKITTWHVISRVQHDRNHTEFGSSHSKRIFRQLFQTNCWTAWPSVTFQAVNNITNIAVSPAVSRSEVSQAASDKGYQPVCNPPPPTTWLQSANLSALNHDEDSKNYKARQCETHFHLIKL